MRFEFVTFAVGAFLYICYLCGLYMLLENCIASIKKQFSLRHRLKAMARPRRALTKPELFVKNTIGASIESVDERTFIMLEALLFLVLLLPALHNFSLPVAVITAALGAFVPVLVLLARLSMDRSKGSREGISLVTELYRQYRINNRNMYEALSATASSDGDYPVLRRHVYRLLLRLRSAGSPKEIMESLDRFTFSIGTVWSSMLSTCIRLSVEKGYDVSDGLADIGEQLKVANKRAEERRRLNSESQRMTMLLIPALYAGTLVLSVRYLDVPVKQLLKNQFLTPEGFLFFILIVFLFLANLLIINAVSNTKLDY